MAEFEPPISQPSPEQQLFARLKLQRVVFGAFAVVLVTLFALGLSAYRSMEAERDAAKEAQADATTAAHVARSEREIREREFQGVSAELAESRRRLALSKCRNAMHEIRDGYGARAVTLLAEARELGAPPWWPLVEHLSSELTIRFEGSEFPTAAIIAGAVSADRTVVAVARAGGGGVVVEVYGALDGKLLRAYPPAETGPVESLNGRLLLSRDGSAWFLSLTGRAYYGVNGTLSVVANIAAAGPEAAVGIAGTDDLSLIYEAHGRHGLVVRRRENDQWTAEVITLDIENPAVEAVCLAGDKPVAANATGVYFVGAGGRTGKWHDFEPGARRLALSYGPGVVYAAASFGRTLELVAIKPGESPHVTTTRHEMTVDAEDLRFMLDGSAVWIGMAGRLVIADFTGTREWNLGGHTLSFIERHAHGLVFANRRGELSLRTQAEFATTGVPLQLVPPEFGVELSAHGFILATPGSDRIVLQDGRVRLLEHPRDVELTPGGPAWKDEQLVLPDGSRSKEEGELIGAFSDGSVLLFSSPKKLRHVSAKSVSEFLLNTDRVPDAVAVAAEATVAALRLGDSVYIADMERDPVRVASRMESAPDLVALDAGGLHIAIAYGPRVVIGDWREGVEIEVHTAAPPRQIALLFSGTVLVTVEGGNLVFYEAKSGRELLRAGTGVTDVEASADDSLNLVVEGRMQELKLEQ